jgi:ethanolamine ammonia-lyase small subunit
MNAPVIPASWQTLRRFTDARIALGRAGHSQPTAAHLAFQLAHAQARDAVHLAFDPAPLARELQAFGLKTVPLRSAAPDRPTYLQRPDLGRRLDDASRALIEPRTPAEAAPDLAFVIADGLSALAVMHHTVPLLTALLPLLAADASQPWQLGPVALVEQGRVAIGDEIGQQLRARTVVVLIGERPGLSSPDSLGIYFTWAPRVGRTDAERNCISNVRDAGLPPARAAARLHALLSLARQRGQSGVGLKDETDDTPDALSRN